ncbi:lipid kinase [Alkalilimnicola ehrlichii]|uniref:lipid kinase n=1 Tax=Alkalilimnicola ehrlichii TaxID=351052 RepID=UPI0015F25388|nr:lipid kinase [Alkalilimnicola ehrlichii]
MPGHNALLIANRACRDGEIDLKPALAQLDERGVAAHVVYPDGVAELQRDIREASGRWGTVIVAGGDGTLHAAIPALREADVVLGILPLGTANDLARGLDIPLDLVGAAEVIGSGRVRPIDIAAVNDTFFLNAASIGLGVAVTRELSNSGNLKRRWGALSYARALVNAMSNVDAFRVRLTIDGEQKSVRSLQVTIGNGPYYGGGMAIAPEARVDDGTLYLYSVAPRPFWQLARLLTAIPRGGQGRYPQVLAQQARRIQVDTDEPLPITADGEPCGKTPATFEVLPAEVRVWVP